MDMSVETVPYIDFETAKTLLRLFRRMGIDHPRSTTTTRMLRTIVACVEEIATLADERDKDRRDPSRTQVVATLVDILDYCHCDLVDKFFLDYTWEGRVYLLQDVVGELIDHYTDKEEETAETGESASRRVFVTKRPRHVAAWDKHLERKPELRALLAKLRVLR